MNVSDKLDKVDLQILRTLQDNARLTTKELAARVSLSSTPVFERLKRLENSGYIKKYIAVLDAEKLNQQCRFCVHGADSCPAGADHDLRKRLQM